MQTYFLNESCFIYSLSDKLDFDDNSKVIKMYKQISTDKLFCQQYQIFDIVPTYNSIAFHTNFLDLVLFEEAILRRIELVDYSLEGVFTTHQIFVDYNGEDIKSVSKSLNLSENEIIERHTKPVYTIAMLGFKPYFPYLLGLDESISVQRLSTPRNRIAKGSIGIGGLQTTIFPEQSPSGWNIIGNSSFDDFSSFNAGDKIIFRSK